MKDDKQNDRHGVVLSDGELLLAFNSGETVVDGLNKVIALATQNRSVPQCSTFDTFMANALAGEDKDEGGTHMYSLEFVRKCWDAASRASSSLAEVDIPEGYVLVPKEPTEKMIAAAIRERADARDISAGRKSYPAIETNRTYRAMIAAAEAPNGDKS